METISFSPGPSGSGSETMSPTPTTPGSELKMWSSGVSRRHSGRSPSASAENTHSSSWRAISATGPWANGPMASRRYMKNGCRSAGSERISLTTGGTISSIASARLRPSTRTRWSIVRLRSIESDPPSGISTPSARASCRSCSIVLISPLWPRIENGCTRRNDGQVLVEYRLWPKQAAVSKRSSARSL